MSYQELIKNMNDTELIKEFKSLDYSIYVAQCYSTKDIVMANLVSEEMGYRGLTLETELCDDD